MLHKHGASVNPKADEPPPKPDPMPVNAEAIPEALRWLPRWLGWRWEWNRKKHGGRGGWDKPPLDIRTGRKTAAPDPRSWVPFEQALDAHRRGDFDGIGIALGKVGDDGPTLAGLDLDDVCDQATGEIQQWALWYVHKLETYTEISPSGTGLKALAWGKLPPGGRENEAAGIELYDSGRYFCVTGNRLTDLPAEVMHRADRLALLHAHAFPKPHFTFAVKAVIPPDCEVALSALAGLSTSRARGYGDWLAVGMALHSVSPDLLDAWDSWSKSCPEKYEEGACKKKWASFKGSGITLGSLIYWARQDGWTPPWEKASSNGHDADAAASVGQTTAQTTGGALDGIGIILAHFQGEYEPTFRRGTVIYSARLAREVKPTEACFAADRELLEKLAHATDVPRDRKAKVDPSALPAFFWTFAKTAWKELIKPLPEEEESGEVVESAREEFRRLVASGLYTQATFTDANGNPERRTLLQWACVWAKPGPWKDVRAALLWCRIDESGRTAVALRVELFGQYGPRELARMKQRQFANLAEMYDVGTSTEQERPGGKRAVVLSHEFLDFLCNPELPDCRENSHAGAREKPSGNSARSEEHAEKQG
jgi:hypothetical protein